MVTVSDITSKVLTERELAQTQLDYKNLFENLIDEVHVWKVIKDDNDQIINWSLLNANPPVLRSWNKSKEEVIGKLTTEIFGESPVYQFIDLVKKIFKTGKPHTWEEYFPPTNQYLWMTSIPIGDVFISTGRDITEIKLNELKLIEAKDEAEHANQLKTKFIHNMSHEIRTPMNGILGFTDLLKSNDLTEDQRKYYIKVIEESGNQLLKIIDDIIEISTLDSKILMLN